MLKTGRKPDLRRFGALEQPTAGSKSEANSRIFNQQVMKTVGFPSFSATC